MYTQITLQVVTFGLMHGLHGKELAKQPVRNTLIEVTLIINGKMVRLQSYRPITVNMPSKMKLLLMPLHRTKLDTHSLSGYLIRF